MESRFWPSVNRPWSHDAGSTLEHSHLEVAGWQELELGQKCSAKIRLLSFLIENELRLVVEVIILY